VAVSETIKKLKKAVLEGDDDLALSLAQKCLEEGAQALAIVNEAIVAGIQEAGELWKKNEYFQTDMIMCAEAFRVAMEVVEPNITAGDTSTAGKFVIGTVAGDMHNLGKMMVVAMLRGAGFHVVDLGEDVPTRTFIDKVKELEPDILGLGCYMTPTMAEMENVIKYLDESGLRDRVKVMIGGVPTSQQYANESGADAWGKDALDAVEKAQRLMDGGKLE
jgi:5-methyltetrahydrofolate--homocysteine methyltransferase